MPVRDGVLYQTHSPTPTPTLCGLLADGKQVTLWHASQRAPSTVLYCTHRLARVVHVNGGAWARVTLESRVVVVGKPCWFYTYTPGSLETI